MKYFILVTGASSGIGEQICKVAIRHGYRVLAGIRTIDDGHRLTALYGSGLHPLLMDVTKQDHLTEARNSAKEIIGSDALVAIFNNAGIVISGAVLYIPVDEWQRQFDINLHGVIRTTQLFFPLLALQKSPGDQHPRRIINISSVSGLFASPFLGPYVASKYALEAMSDSLRRELYMYDIQVVLLEPGSIRTPMWSKARESKSWFGPEYDGILAFKDKVIEKNVESGLEPEAMDSHILRALQGKKVKPRYLIRKQKWKFNLVRWLPVSWVDRMIRKRLQEGSGIRPF